MLKEKTVVIIKPEGKRVGMTEKFVESCRSEGLTVVAFNTLVLTEADVQVIYADKIGDESFETGKLLRQVTCGPVDIFLIEGNDAVSVVRSDHIIGKTHLNIGLRGWIKANYYFDESFWEAIKASTGDDPHGKEYRYNGIHASSSTEEAERDWSYFIGRILNNE
ncbi:hypothetical protein HZB69_02790 [Candidatus Amesbacteria bacterium]|nr:hypothetical protein [Candidatus Amesbacteria bacterium]